MVTKQFIIDNLLQVNGLSLNARALERHNIKETNETLFLIYNDLDEPPICPVCHSKVPFMNFKIGFQKTCSIKCGKNCDEFPDRKLSIPQENIRVFYLPQNFVVVGKL